MTLTQLEYFVETVHVQSFTKAAIKLFVSQPTLSRAIQNIENELNVILIDRDEKHFQLTKNGQIFYAYAKDVLDYYRIKTSDMMGMLEKKDNILRIGIIPTSGAIYFFSAINRFKKLYPVVDLVIEEVTTQQGIDMVLNGQLDMSAAIEPVEESQLIRMPVVSSEAVLVTAKNHPFTKHRKISFSEIENEEILMVGKDYQYHDIVVRKMEEAGISPKFAFESNQWEFVFEMVANGHGVSILPKPLVDKFNNSRVVQIHLENPDFPWTLSLVRKKDRFFSTACQYFWNMCEKE